MSMQVNNSQSVSPTSDSTTSQLSAEEVKSALVSLKNKIQQAQSQASAASSDPKTIKALMDQEEAFGSQLETLSSQVKQLQNKGSVASAQVSELQTQAAEVVQQQGYLQAAIGAMTASYITAGAPTTKTTAPVGNSPVIPAPVTTTSPTSINQETKINLFLAPSLATIIFTIMQKVVKQKNENVDTYRQFMQSYIAATEQFALSAAQATLLHGQNEANAMIAQGSAQLIGAFLQIGLASASTLMAGKKLAEAEAPYKTQMAKVEKDVSLSPNEKDKLLSDLGNQRSTAIQKALQSEPALKSIQVLEQTVPGIANSIGTIVGAGYKIDAANAEAAKLLWQQAIQAAQAIVQDLQQGISASTQDIAQFLQAVEGISHSLTQQA